MNNYEQIIGNNLKKLRQLAGLSQEKLGDLTDLHFSYIGQIERGEKSPSLRTLINIAGALGVPVSTLLKIEEHTFTQKENFMQQFKSMITNQSPEDIQFGLEQLRLTLNHCQKIRKKQK